MKNYSSQTTFAFDKISEFNDEELYKKLYEIQKKIESAKKNSHLLKALETDLCYFQRETQVRHQRKAKHSEYVTKRQQRHRYTSRR